MDAPLLAPQLTALAILVCSVLLALVCLDCLGTGPLVSIQEEDATDEYIPSTDFRLVRPHLQTSRVTSDLLSPLAGSSNPGQRACRPVTPTQSESNASYENSQEGLDDPQGFAGDYVIVLPEEQGAPANQSAASTPSSGAPHEYVNVFPDDRDYLNVMLAPPSADLPLSASPAMASTPANGGTSTSSQSEEEDDDDDDEGVGNYVNQLSVSWAGA